VTSLHWPDLRNARDVGGLPTTDGRRIRERALIRSDDHVRLDPGGVAALRSYGVSRVVDLRWAWEAAELPSPLAEDLLYRLVPACFDLTGDEVIPVDSYRLMVDASRERLAAAITAVAQAPPGGVVLHCREGRDRTGLVVALALNVAGATVEGITSDYARSAGSPAYMITNTLRHLDSVYGGVTRYLLGSGVTPTDLAAVRSRLTDV